MVSAAISGDMQRNLAEDRDSTVAADRKKRDLANHVADLAAKCLVRLGKRGLERLERGIARNGDVRLVGEVAPEVRKERARIELVVERGDGGGAARGHQEHELVRVDARSPERDRNRRPAA